MQQTRNILVTELSHNFVHADASQILVIVEPVVPVKSGAARDDAVPAETA